MRILTTMAILLLSTNTFAQERVNDEAYKELLEVTSKMIENTSHDEWTDYNVHDPGITMLEMVCYAITDLGIRRGKSHKMCNIIKNMNELPRRRGLNHRDF